MKRNKQLRMVMLSALAGLMVVLSACSDKTGQATPEASASAAPSASAAEATASAPADPMAKYDPPIELSTVAFEMENSKYPAGDDINNNVWKREYLNQLGINIKNLWVATDTPEVRDQKMSVTIASGNLPDIMSVSARELQMLIESDMIADLTDVYEQYASEDIKRIYAFNNNISLEAASSKGRLMAIPATTGGGVDNAPLVWVRTDWLEKLKLAPPKTMADVIDIARAFTKNDPDGNSKNDTFGLAIGKNVYDGFAGVEGFFSGYHAYPYNGNETMWQKDEASGQLVYGSIQPQVKEGLIALNAMFSEGLIDPEFAVKDGNKVAESVTSGKIGLHFGAFWNASWPLNDLKQRDNAAEWMPYPLVSVDGTPAKAAIPQPVPSMFYVVKKGVEHPEAAIKMLNMYYDKIYSDKAESSKYHTVVEPNGEKVQVFSSATIGTTKPDQNINAHELVTEALRTDDTSKLNEEYMGYYTQMKAAKDGSNLTGWYLNPIFGENGAYAIIKQYNEENRILSNAFYGTPTPTMIEKGSFLKQQEFETFTKIIMGAAAPDSFDKFVADWKSLGGDQITKEVNEWYSSNQ